MSGKTRAKLWVCTSGILMGGLALPAAAQLAVTGNLTTTGVTYTAPAPGTGALTTQTINTSFGDNTSSTGHLTGTELDASYGVVQSGYLYVFLAGNLQDNGNVLDVWIDSGSATGQNVLNAATTAGNMGKKENGSVFSTGFNANYALEINMTDLTPNTNNTFFVDQYSLSTNAPANTATFLGSFTTTSGVGKSTETGSTESAILVGITNTNTAGVLGSSLGTAATGTAAQNVATGIELGIPLTALGSPTSNILVLAGINGSGDSGFANQFLPGLEVNTPSIKNGNPGTLTPPETNPYFLTSTEFTFASTPNEFFTVPNVVVPNGNWLPTGGGNWNNTANWSNSVIPTNAGDTANFTSATTTSVVNLDANETVGTLNFNNVNSYTISANPGMSLTFDNGGPTATANIGDFGGVHTISAPLILNSNLTVTCSNHGDAMYISGNISGTGGLTVSNSGPFQSTFSALVLSGTDTYQGPTVISRGELQLASAGALPTGTALTINGASPHGILDLNGFNVTVDSLSGTGGAAIVNTSTTTGTTMFTYSGNPANPDTFAGAISDSSSTGGATTALTLTSGSLTLSGSNTYAGNTTIGAGATLDWSSTTGASLPVNGNVADNGSTIVDDNLVAGSFTGTGTLTVDNSFSISATTLTLPTLTNNGSVNITGVGTVPTISGTGTLDISGGGSLLTTNIVQGTLANGGNTTIQSTGTIGIVSGPGTLTLAGGGNLTASILDQGALINNGSVTVQASGGVGPVSGTGTITVNASASLTTGDFTQNGLINNGSANIQGNGTVGPISGTGALTVGSGAGASTLALASNSGMSTQGSVTVNAGSVLDIGNSGIAINYGNSANQAAVDAQILGYLSGASYSQAPQTGTSIVSSSLATNTQYAIGEVDGNDAVSGTPVAANTLEIAYTLQGDLNLDGVVNGTDFSILVTHFGQPLTGIGWEQGDINGDGIVNGSDFSALVTNFGAANNSGAGLGNSDGGLITVPEPATAGLLVLAGMGALAGRRRPKRSS